MITGKTYFVSLSSGSNGNCYYICNGDKAILIDAGIGPRTIRKRLKDLNLPFENIVGLFVTHDHIDHIKGAGTLVEKFFIPVYSTEFILQGMNRCYGMTQKIRKENTRTMEKDVEIELFGFKITAFHVSHDGTDNVGYKIISNDSCITLVTDTGYITEQSIPHIKQANLLVIESNYDEKMLKNGPYPIDLQNRIRGREGHLCNDCTADFLANNYENHLHHILLCHLSKDNNTPELAYETISKALLHAGISTKKDVYLEALPRNFASRIFII